MRGTRSTLGGHYAGTGMWSSSEDREETWEDKNVAVRLPSDHLKGDKLAELSGPVITYNIYSGGQTHARRD